jgi:hypothetical protein
MRLFAFFAIFLGSNFGFGKDDSAAPAAELAGEGAADSTGAGVDVADVGVLPTLDNSLADFSASSLFCFSAFHFAMFSNLLACLSFSCSSSSIRLESWEMERRFGLRDRRWPFLRPLRELP